MRLGSAGAVEDCALVAFGLDATAVRCEAGEQVLTGEQPTEGLFAEAAAAAVAPLSPGSDMHGSADYRKRVGAVYVERVIEQACARAAGEAG
jgi:aerobic carbon-monoxide dehydrogenase medium subunit